MIRSIASFFYKAACDAKDFIPYECSKAHAEQISGSFLFKV